MGRDDLLHKGLWRRGQEVVDIEILTAAQEKARRSAVQRRGILIEMSRRFLNIIVDIDLVSGKIELDIDPLTGIL